MFCLLPNPKVYFFRHVNFLDRVTNISKCEVGSLSSWREISLGLTDWVSWWNHWSLWFSKYGPAATTHGNLLEMPNSHPKTIESETLRVGHRNQCFNKFFCGFRCLLKFETHRWKEFGITTEDQEPEGKKVFYHHCPPTLCSSPTGLLSLLQNIIFLLLLDFCMNFSPLLDNAFSYFFLNIVLSCLSDRLPQMSVSQGGVPI